MLEEFESMRNEHLKRIKVAQHCIDLLNNEVRPIHTTPFWAGPTVWKFTAVDDSRMITEMIIEPTITE